MVVVYLKSIHTTHCALSTSVFRLLTIISNLNRTEATDPESINSDHHMPSLQVLQLLIDFHRERESNPRVIHDCLPTKCVDEF